MKLIEEQGDLFDLEETHYLAHCISADLALGAGIAVQFVKRYDMRNKLITLRDKQTPTEKFIQDIFGSPNCVLIDRVFNLITKEHCWHKPTYDSFTIALEDMKRYVEYSYYTKIAMPRIGCGLDGLEWDLVKPIIETTFRGYDGEIVVRYL
jgi:O-acetyl-ADP-ribose deacetylase (regulator of RNase III)